jgi:serine/threonine protein kinase/Tfp pilus assembly protein PilF
LDKVKINIVKSVFEQALDIDLKERQIFLDDKCGDDKELKKEVLSLLDAHNQADDFLEIPPNIKEKKSHPDKDQFIGTRIGNYLIEAEAGVGGMGIVYIGKRDDKEFKHKVAIKILRHHFNSEYVIKRFQNERQTLANLQHPNIARLLDGGTTAEGLPYLVMEYIDGKSLLEYCDDKNLNISQRLEIFRLVCGAVQYAHQNLVVHRDIKPGNVLVNKEGRPKLLDFGIAKLMDEELNENEEGLTKTGMWHLTPEYASPEQIKGESITTRSDIYSLGILLYQLLTGHQAYRITVNSPVAIGKIITDEQVIKPSDKFQSTEEISSSDGTIKHITPQSISNSRNEKPEKIFQHLKGDIDNIILKAIHKDPVRRYTSAEQFSEDIRRHLIGLPVIARKDTIKYRFSKFVQRHKVGVSLFIIFNFIILFSIVAIIYQANIASEERDKAQTELEKFDEVNNFLLEMLASADPEVKGRDVKVFDLLEKATEDVNVKLKNHPKIKSAIKQTLGSTFIGLGEYDKAKTLLTESLEANKILYGLHSKEAAKSSHQLGLCYDWIGNYPLADSFYNQGIFIYDKILEKPTKDFADNLNDYGTYMTNMGLYDSASVLFKRSLDIYGMYSEEKGQKEAITINNLAVNLHHQNKVDEAEKYYSEALNILTNLYGINRPEVASIYNNLAFIYMDNKNYDASENAFKKAYEIKTAVLGKGHPSIGLALSNLGMLYFVKGDYLKAEIPLQESINFFYRIKALEDPFLSLAYYWLGRAYLESNQLNESEEVLRKSILIREELFSKNHSKTFSSVGELAICLLKQKRYSESEKLLNETLEFYKNDKFRDLKKITRYTEYSAILYKEIGNKSLANSYQTKFEKLKNETPSLR